MKKMINRWWRLIAARLTGEGDGEGGERVVHAAAGEGQVPRVHGAAGRVGVAARAHPRRRAPPHHAHRGLQGLSAAQQQR